MLVVTWREPRGAGMTVFLVWASTCAMPSTSANPITGSNLLTLRNGASVPLNRASTIACAGPPSGPG